MRKYPGGAVARSIRSNTMKEQEKKPTTEQTKPETLTDEEVSSVAGGNSTPAIPAIVDGGGLVVAAPNGPMPQTRE